VFSTATMYNMLGINYHKDYPLSWIASRSLRDIIPAPQTLLLRIPFV